MNSFEQRNALDCDVMTGKSDSINKRVLVALSGGLDSAAVVMMLKEAGCYDVAALYLDFTNSPQARAQAQRVAEMVGVKLNVLNVSEAFESKVIEYMLTSHQLGETPSPCAICNPMIKWGAMCDYAKEHGFDSIATGHYVRLSQIDNTYVIERGVDPQKDQSYYLWGLTQQQLGMCILPLGGMTKVKVREYLSDRGLNLLSKSSESMSLCFLNRENGQKPFSYSEYLVHKLGNDSVKSGDVVDRITGQIIGRHRGYQLYTIGQKRGFDLSSSYMMGSNNSRLPAVVEVNAQNNTIVVDSNADSLYSENFVCRDLITNLPELLESEREHISVVVRGLGRNPDSPARSIRVDIHKCTVEVRLESPGAWAMAKGQPVVFYYQDKVIAGAIFDHNL